MKESIVYGATLPEAYHKALSYLELLGAVTDCPAYHTRCKELAMTMVVRHPTQEPRISRCGIFGPGDLQQYCMELLDGILDFEAEAGKWEYTYHQRMTNPRDQIDQIHFVTRELQRNPDSRRAVVDVRSVRDDVLSEDPACLQHIQFLLRDGALHMQVLFRSNDAVKAAFMNAFALIRLQERIADTLGVPVGTYTHRANSFHSYERDWPMLEGFCDRMGLDEDTLTYNYAGDWEAQMEEAVPGILEKVRRLKNDDV